MATILASRPPRHCVRPRSWLFHQPVFLHHPTFSLPAAHSHIHPTYRHNPPNTSYWPAESSIGHSSPRRHGRNPPTRSTSTTSTRCSSSPPSSRSTSTCRSPSAARPQQRGKCSPELSPRTWLVVPQIVHVCFRALRERHLAPNLHAGLRHHILSTTETKPLHRCIPSCKKTL